MSDNTQLKFAAGLCGEYSVDIMGINAADEFVDEVVTLTAPSGHRPSGSIGPYEDGESFTARLSIAIGRKRAYLRWGDSIAVEPGRADSVADTDPLTIHDDDDNITELPPTHLLVSPGRARQAVREYVETGERPTCVEWAEDQE